ncbi:M23 family metallopeptidase [Lunatimonas salinarum]|uniref:M23 family metallopeptidase n=1 Tax=Lunatimonas salinarum TaxID=1774590 RepID=UPI001AE0BEF6|nr:M23 family metallopeptidase [Lunatimonas salinarum]
MSKLSNQNLWALLLGILTQVSLYAQVQQGYFTFPIKPGERNFLAGTMGEIRPNHFHSGIDIKTEGRQGLPVFAAADGYVYRMKISSFGYGNVLYVKHPSGNTTVYAHLREFAPSIADYMRERMYAERKNELEYFPEAREIPVKKGEIIAYSGNTGSSMGPHLHFEIRDSLDRALNPLHFGFSEIIDRTPPFAQRIAITPLDQHSRVQGIYARKEFPLIQAGEAFYLVSPVSVSGKVGIEVLAYDQLDDMYNRNGFPTYEVFEAERRIFRSTVNPIDFSIGRYILSHTYRNQYTRLYKLPNNRFPFYEPDSAWAGAIQVTPHQEREFRINMRDTYENVRTLHLTLTGEAALERLHVPNTTSGTTSIAYEGNLLLVHDNAKVAGDFATFHVNGYQMEMPYAYRDANKRTYIWDMSLGRPDSVALCSHTVYPQVNALVKVDTETLYADDYCEIIFDEKSLLDDLYLRVNHLRDDTVPGIVINDPREYLREPIRITFSPKAYRGDRSHTQVYLRHENGRLSFQGGQWEGDKMRFTTRSLGTFVLATDSVPPLIQPMRVSASEIRFTIRDGMSGIRDFEAYVDGEWVLMRYEHKQSMIWSEKKSNEPFNGEVLVKVRDMANNEAIYRGKI